MLVLILLLISRLINRSGLRKFSKDIWGWYIFKILEISQMTWYLGNFPKAKFPKYLVDLKNFRNFENIPLLNTFWEITQIPRHLVSFPNTYRCLFEGGLFSRFWKFLKWRDIWGIFQRPWYLGNFLKGSDRPCKVVELSIQSCGKLFLDSFET